MAQWLRVEVAVVGAWGEGWEPPERTRVRRRVASPVRVTSRRRGATSGITSHVAAGAGEGGVEGDGLAAAVDPEDRREGMAAGGGGQVDEGAVAVVVDRVRRPGEAVPRPEGAVEGVVEVERAGLGGGEDAGRGRWRRGRRCRGPGGQGSVRRLAGRGAGGGAGDGLGPLAGVAEGAQGVVGRPPRRGRAVAGSVAAGAGARSSRT